MHKLHELLVAKSCLWFSLETSRKGQLKQKRLVGNGRYFGNPIMLILPGEREKLSYKHPGCKKAAERFGIALLPTSIRHPHLDGDVQAICSGSYRSVDLGLQATSPVFLLFSITNTPVASHSHHFIPNDHQMFLLPSFMLLSLLTSSNVRKKRGIGQ